MCSTGTPPGASLVGCSSGGGGDATVTNCTFTNNEAVTWSGAAEIASGRSATYTNCVFRDNSAEFGGATINTFVTATFTNCVFIGNSAGNRAGAMDNQDGTVVTVTNCTFSGNSAGNMGGGVAMVDFGSGFPPNLTLNGCTFRGNVAPLGGAIRNFGGASPTINNCLFVGNRAFDSGGAIDNFDNSDPVLTHCTLYGNSADVGGGIHSLNSSPTISNTILWGNSDSGGINESSQILTEFGTSVVNYSNVQGLTGDLGGVGNIDLYPLLTPDGHLRSGSPCIDAGDPLFVIDPTSPLDIDGDLRVVGGRVDIGADEYVDLDLDKLPDWWELKHFISTVAGDAALDSDNDSLTNLDEYERFSSNPIAQPYYVHGITGKDTNDGLNPVQVAKALVPRRPFRARLISQTMVTRFWFFHKTTRIAVC